MEEQFVPYEIAKELKSLGFDEECFGFFYNEQDFEIAISKVVDQICKDFNLIKRPLWQQAIDFLREHYNYNITYNVLEHSFDIAYVFKGGPSKSKFKILSKSSDFYIARERAILTALSRITLNT